MVVLLAGDAYSGLQIMVLRSKDTNMTYEQRLTVIKPKTKHLLDFKHLKKVDQDECITMDEIPKFKANCTEFNANIKRKIISRLIYRSLLLAIVTSGLLCITINVLSWVVKRRHRAIVVPTQGPLRRW